MDDKLADLEQQLEEVRLLYEDTRQKLNQARKLEMTAVALASFGLIFSIMVLLLKIVR